MHFDAAIFDMDGVITDTAALHAAAWKKMFDAFLARHGDRSGLPQRPFTQDDYLAYVDGKPRYDGVTSFLKSRDIALPTGAPLDSPDSETVCGLGNHKDRLFNRVLDANGVEVFRTTLCLMETLRRSGIRLAVATSSQNGASVLEKAGICDLFDVRVDGVTAAELGLWGKPAPDIFALACERLGAARHRTMVIEDAVSGVAAGSRGRFGLTLGLARADDGEELRRNGADIVVRDLSEITLADIDHWFECMVRTQPGAPGTSMQ